MSPGVDSRFVSLPKVHMLKLSPLNVAVFGDRASKEVMKIEWGHKGGALMQQY